MQADIHIMSEGNWTNRVAPFSEALETLRISGKTEGDLNRQTLGVTKGEYTLLCLEAKSTFLFRWTHRHSRASRSQPNTWHMIKFSNEDNKGYVVAASTRSGCVSAMMRKKDGTEQRRRVMEQHGPTTMEEENDACILDLESRVQSLKHLSLAMRDEVQRSNELLEGMGGSLEGVQASIRSSIKRMENLWKQGGGWHTCYLALFVVFVFILFYFLYGKSRA